jgi:hypothetical protein
MSWGDGMVGESLEGGARIIRKGIVGASLAVLVLIGAASVMGGEMPMGGRGGVHEQSSGPSSMMGPGMMGMMCPMMGGPMDPAAMMGMMGSGEMDPKAMARILEFRGDLLKAMGEVMLKHAKTMESAK